MTEFTTIEYGVEDKIATITLNRPDRLNAFTGQMLRDMCDAFDLSDADDEVRAVIVTGSGRAFCAGADLAAGGGTWGSESRQSSPAAAMTDTGVGGLDRDEGGVLSLRIFESLKPVIAAVNGPAVGVGATMLLPMDVRLAADDARFGFVFARRGITAEAASTWFLPRVVGVGTALEWTMTGRLFEAPEALEAGLVRSVHPAADLIGAARQIATEIAENSAPVSVALTRHLMWKGLTTAHPMEAHAIESRSMAARGDSADAAEGVASFKEKRPAAFPERVSTDMPGFFPWWDSKRFR